MVPARLNMVWLKAALTRALRTGAQIALVLLGGGVVTEFGGAAGVDILGAPWLTILSYSAGGAALSMLWSLAGLPELQNESSTRSEADA